MDRFSLKKWIVKPLCRRSAGLTPLLLGFPSQAMGDIGQQQAVPQLTAIHEHVKADADWLTIALENGRVDLIATAIQAQHLNT